jgi:hypothetical protein
VKLGPSQYRKNKERRHSRTGCCGKYLDLTGESKSRPEKTIKCEAFELPTKYLNCGQIKKDEVGRACDGKT